jgi:transposase
MLHHKSGDSAMALVSPCTSTGETDQAPPEVNSDTTASTARRRRPAPGTTGSVGFTGPYAPETRGRFGGDLHDLAATPVTKRFEVPSAPVKRRIFSAEEKARIVAESFKPGESVCSVARRHHLMSSQLFSWRKHARLQRKQEGFSESGANAAVVQGTERLDPTSPSSKQASPIEIAIGTTIVRVPEGADAATLRAVLRR